MNISGGLSEITIPGNAASYGAQKVYLWPVYNEGKVDPVFRVAREKDGQVFYTKTAPDERDSIIEESYKNSVELYSRNGIKGRSMMSSAGSLFDAYV